MFLPAQLTRSLIRGLPPEVEGKDGARRELRQETMRVGNHVYHHRMSFGALSLECTDGFGEGRLDGRYGGTFAPVEGG